MNLREFEQIFKAFSDKQRLRILSLLSRGPLVVNDIKNVLHLSMSTISQHLMILRNAKLVIDDKKGRWVYYSLTDIIQDTNTLEGKIYSDLSPHFTEEETFVYDYKLLTKINQPSIVVGK